MTQPRLNLNSSTYKEELDAANAVIHELRLQLAASQAREEAYRAEVVKLSGELAEDKVIEAEE